MIVSVFMLETQNVYARIDVRTCRKPIPPQGDSQPDAEPARQVHGPARRR